MINASKCKVGQVAVQHESMDELFPVFNRGASEAPLKKSDVETKN